jgi:hypothetical protein
MALTGADEGINEGLDVVFVDIGVLPADCCFSAFRFIVQCCGNSPKTWFSVDNAAMKPISKKSWHVVRAPAEQKKKIGRSPPFNVAETRQFA